MEGPDIDGRGHPLLYAIRDALYNLSLEGRKIVLIWIPDHAGITGNERDDTLALEGALGRPTDAHEKFIFPSNIRGKLTEDTNNEHATSIMDQTRYKGYRYFAIE